MSLPFLNNAIDLDPSYETDLDFWIALEGKTPRLITKGIGYAKILSIGKDSSEKQCKPKSGCSN